MAKIKMACPELRMPTNRIAGKYGGFRRHTVDTSETHAKLDALIHRRYDMPRMEKGKLKNTIAMFESMSEETEEKLKVNPYSDTYEKPEHKITDHRYGRPTQGSLTERRGIAAGMIFWHFPQESFLLPFSVIFLRSVVKSDHYQLLPLPSFFLKNNQTLFSLYFDRERYK